MPYTAYPYPKTHPSHLCTIGELMGLKPSDPKSARVLDLGCGTGGNIIPMAYQYKDAEFIGVDIDKEAITEGNALIKELGLTNITLTASSINEVKKEIGFFDYIIIHGVFSWVDHDTQEAILALCKNHLHPEGIAYISYNTYPGWHSLQGMRHMMHYHASSFKEDELKASQARAMLEFIASGAVQGSPHHAQALQREHQLLNEHPDFYVLNEFFGLHNQPFYFHEFIERVTPHGLHYLADSTLSTMFIGGLPEATKNMLAQMAGDVVRVEQYMDFITNRRFRSTLLCHADKAVNRKLNKNQLRPYHARNMMGKMGEDLSKGLSFTTPSGMVMRSEDPVLISMMEHMESAISKTIATEELISNVAKQHHNKTKAEVEEIVLDSLLNLYVTGGITFHKTPIASAQKPNNKPKLCPLAAAQLKTQNWLSTAIHEKAAIGGIERVIALYLDDSNTKEEIVQKVYEHAQKDSTWLSAEELVGASDMKMLEHVVTEAVEGFAGLGVLLVG